MTITQDLFDRQVEHSIRTRRYGESTKLLIERASKAHRSRLQKLLEGDLRADFKPEVRRYVQELYSKSSDSIRDFFGSEIDFQRNSLERSVGDWYKVQRPNKRTTAALFQRTPLKITEEGTKQTLKASMQNIGSSEITRINSRIRRGIAQGKERDEIIKQVLKTSKLSEHQAKKTLVTTNITHAESTVKEAFILNNSELFSSVIYSAILDSRTSRVCSSLDGKIQAPDNIKYRPPMHWNCRSTLSYVMKTQSALLETRSDRINHKKLAQVPGGLLSGSQPASESFTQWLHRQPHATKLRYLDTDERIALFQNGNLKVSDFLSFKGNPISLAVLRRLDNLATFFAPTRTKATSRLHESTVARPFQIIRSRKLQADLRDMFLEDAVNSSRALSLVDYKGTTLIGKRSVRSRVNNTFDPRTQQVDPFTGQVKNTLYYDPDFSTFRERIDYMKNSKLLDRKQKEFIENFVETMDNRISVNQKTAIVENLRVVFERYQRDKVPFDDFPAVLRNEMNYSVVNTSRILDRRSRSRAELFDGWTGDPKEPSVMILGEKVTLDDLHKYKGKNERLARNWQLNEGEILARKLILKRGAPWRSYFFERSKKPKSFTEKLVDSYKKKTIRKIFYRDNPEGFFLRYGKIKGIKDLIKDQLKKELKDPIIDRIVAIYKEGAREYFLRTIREQYRYLIDLEWFYEKNRRRLFPAILDDAIDSKKEEEMVKVFSKILTTAGRGLATDYDSLAIQLGQTTIQSWQPFFFRASTLQSFHQEGSRILEFMQKEGLIRINSRGVTRRAITDLDTLRPSGAWKDTVSREIQFVHPDLIALQKAERKVLLANRIGVDRPENRYYVAIGKKNYVDARGNDTGIPMVTRSAYANFDEKMIDSDFANSLNWQMQSKYEVDPEFAPFMDSVVRFKDNRGRAEYYDEINHFRDEIVRRGDQGYGLMETIRYYNAKKTPFSVNARIDGRGRMYYNGYLTPTGGEIVRPFLNSHNATAMTPAGLKQIQIQMAAVIGPGTEALTTAGRLAIFKRHEKDILRVGKLMTETTQKDRRIREFLDDPFMRTIEGEEVAKIARFSLEYYRIHRHTKGDVNNPVKLATYKSKLMGEADASASGLQVIALSTGNRGAALSSNVLPTKQKQRIYDLTAQDTASDPRFQAMLKELNIELTWEDLSKAAKYQNMIALYGAGQTGQNARVAVEMANVLRKKELVVTTRAEYLAIRKKVDAKIKEAEVFGAEDSALALKALRKELDELAAANKEKVVDAALISAAEEIHPDVGDFVRKYTNTRNPVIGPENFKLIARLLSESLAERAPVTQTYIEFWKRVATDYAKTTGKVDIPWVTFDKKKFVQKYRPKVQHEVRFYDPESKRYIRNIYQMTAEDGKLRGKGSIGDVRLGLAVNGNHSLDASLLRMYHLDSRKNGVPSASIHDAIFHNINQLDEGTEYFFKAYQKARDADNIRDTLEAIRDAGLPKDLYLKYLKEAEQLGFFEDGFDSAEILRTLKDGEDRYGIGP